MVCIKREDNQEHIIRQLRFHTVQHVGLFLTQGCINDWLPSGGINEAYSLKTWTFVFTWQEKSPENGKSSSYIKGMTPNLKHFSCLCKMQFYCVMSQVSLNQASLFLETRPITVKKGKYHYKIKVEVNEQSTKWKIYGASEWLLIQLKIDELNVNW